MDRKHLERVLRINGVLPTAPEEQIREVLVSAKYRDDEVEAALRVLRENATATTARVDGLHKVFRTDGLLNAQEVSKLLGIEITVHDKEVSNGRRYRVTPFHGREPILIAILSVLLAVGGVMFAMRVMEFGVFHPTAALVIYDAW